MKNFFCFFILLLIMFIGCNKKSEYWLTNLQNSNQYNKEIVQNLKIYKDKNTKAQLRKILFSNKSNFSTKMMCVKVFVLYDDDDSYEIVKNFYLDKTTEFHLKRYTLLQLTHFTRSDGKKLFVNRIKELIKLNEQTSIYNLLYNSSINKNVNIDDKIIKKIKNIDHDGGLLSALILHYYYTDKKQKIKKLIETDFFKENKVEYLSTLIQFMPLLYTKLSDKHINRLYFIISKKNNASIKALINILLYGNEKIIKKSFSILKNYKLNEIDDIEYLEEVKLKSFYDSFKVKNRIINVDAIYSFFENPKNDFDYRNFFK